MNYTFVNSVTNMTIYFVILMHAKHFCFLWQMQTVAILNANGCDDKRKRLRYFSSAINNHLCSSE